jgi:hypothetical protein
MMIIRLLIQYTLHKDPDLTNSILPDPFHGEWNYTIVLWGT